MTGPSPAGATRAIRYRDRRTGLLETERVFGDQELRALYERTIGRALTDALLTHPAASRVYGLLQRSPLSRGRIARFVEELGIDAAEAELPLEAYGSLDAFFTRRLKAGARPVDPSPDHLVAAADGRVLVIPRLDAAGLPVKGARTSLLELLGGDRSLADQYEGGVAFITRLAPADYHRFHFPDSGTAMAPRRIDGRLHSVHPIALAAGAPSFRNKRELTRFLSRGFGDVVLVEVGALCVGTIVQTFQPGLVERGEEKGYFRFGGSTVVVLVEAGRVEPDADLVRDSAAGIETLVRIGSRVARRIG